MTQHIGYVTRDEVNADLARRTGLPGDIDVCHSDTEDGLPNFQLLGIAYDLDHMWADEQRSVIRSLCDAPSPIPIAVHSYNLDDDQSLEMRLMGVAVYRQLDEEIFQQLAGAIPVRRAA